MAIGDLYELVDKQVHLGQFVTNVYHYENRREGGTATQLADAFVGDVLPWITLCQSENLEHREIIVVNLDDPTDFAQSAISIFGGIGETSDDLPVFLAMRVRILRSSREIRNGAKRYAGLKEAGVAGNSLGTLHLAPLTDLATHLTDPVTGAPTGEWDLVLYGRQTPNRAVPIRVDVDSCAADPFVSTQNSRKPWVGT